MNKFINLLFKRPIIIVLIIILLFFFPAGLATAPEGVDLLHAVSIGIDKAEEGLEVSVLAFVITPHEQFSESYFLISAKAETLTEAMDLIGINLGKRLITVHTGIIVISQEFAEAGLLDSFNYLFRSNSITNDTFILCTSSKAKEMLQSEQKLIVSAGARLEELGLFNEKYLIASDINLQSFYRGYFNPTRSSVISLIELKEEEEATQTSMSGESQQETSTAEGEGGQSSGGGSESEKQKYIQNTGKAIVLYDGKLKTIMDEVEMRGINWLGSNIQNIAIKAENVSDQNYENATLFYSVEGNEVKKNSYFINGKPVMEFTIKLYVRARQVLNEDLWTEKQDISNIKNYLTQAVRDKLENTIKTELSIGLQKLIANQTDVIDIYKTLNYQNHFAFQKWFDALEDKNDYLREVDYRVTVRVKATD